MHLYIITYIINPHDNQVSNEIFDSMSVKLSKSVSDVTQTHMHRS